MVEGLRAELAAMVEPAAWPWLLPHLSRDAVVIVHKGLDLVEVGVAIATDQTPAVERWIGEQLITKPTKPQIEDWSRAEDKRFRALIVQPYVLVQDNLTA